MKKYWEIRCYAKLENYFFLHILVRIISYSAFN